MKKKAKVCKCCGLKLNKYEIKENQGKCFHCIKGNCEKCQKECEGLA